MLVLVISTLEAMVAVLLVSVGIISSNIIVECLDIVLETMKIKI